MDRVGNRVRIESCIVFEKREMTTGILIPNPHRWPPLFIGIYSPWFINILPPALFPTIGHDWIQIQWH